MVGSSGSGSSIPCVTLWGTWTARSCSSLVASGPACAPRIGAAFPGPADRPDGVLTVSVGHHRAQIATPFDMKVAIVVGCKWGSQVVVGWVGGSVNRWFGGLEVRWFGGSVVRCIGGSVIRMGQKCIGMCVIWFNFVAIFQFNSGRVVCFGCQRAMFGDGWWKVVCWFFFCLQFQFFFQFICGWLLMLRCGCSCSWDEHVWKKLLNFAFVFGIRFGFVVIKKRQI